MKCLFGIKIQGVAIRRVHQTILLALDDSRNECYLYSRFLFDSVFLLIDYGIKSIRIDILINRIVMSKPCLSPCVVNNWFFFLSFFFNIMRHAISLSFASSFSILIHISINQIQYLLSKVYLLFRLIIIMSVYWIEWKVGL